MSMLSTHRCRFGRNCDTKVSQSLKKGDLKTSIINIYQREKVTIQYLYRGIILPGTKHLFLLEKVKCKNLKCLHAEVSLL